MLRSHPGALADLAEAMDRGESVADCVAAIERCKDPKGETEAFRRAQVGGQ